MWVCWGGGEGRVDCPVSPGGRLKTVGRLEMVVVWCPYEKVRQGLDGSVLVAIVLESLEVDL